MTVETILQTAYLTKRYGAFPALDRVCLNLTSGRIVGLLGPNGSGKTTLLKLCAGLLTPTAGDIQICGKEVGLETKSLVSYLPDRTYLRGSQTIREQLDLFQDFYVDFDRGRAERMLADLHIDPKSRFQTLSKGNREKVQLVLVMSRRAKLYLLDEPIGGVDPAARDYIIDTVIKNFRPDAAVLISTHLITDIERIMDGFIILKQGKIASIGTPKGLFDKTGLTVDAYFREVFRC